MLRKPQGKGSGLYQLPRHDQDTGHDLLLAPLQAVDGPSDSAATERIGDLPDLVKRNQAVVAATVVTAASYWDREQLKRVQLGLDAQAIAKDGNANHQALPTTGGHRSPRR